MNKHNENVLKAISQLQKQGKAISNKNVHAITGGSIALVGECVKAWKNAQKSPEPATNETPEELKAFSETINNFIIKFANDAANKKTEVLQNEIKELQGESAELVDNIKQVEDEKLLIDTELSTAKSEIIELQKQIAVDSAKTELLLSQNMSDIERLKSDLAELKLEKKELQDLLMKRNEK